MIVANNFILIIQSVPPPVPPPPPPGLPIDGGIIIIIIGAIIYGSLMIWSAHNKKKNIRAIKKDKSNYTIYVRQTK